MALSPYEGKGVELLSIEDRDGNSISVVLNGEQVDDLIANLTALRARVVLNSKDRIEGEDYRT
jgi:hypothetical protein